MHEAPLHPLGPDEVWHKECLGVAFVFALSATVLATRLAWRHWVSFVNPTQQIQIVRIVMMVPVYAVASFLSLAFVEHAPVIDLCRDVYEGFVIYSFIKLLVDLAGGEESLAKLLARSHAQQHSVPLNYVLPPYRLGGVFLFRVKQVVLQYVFVKPAMAVVALVCEHLEVYGEGKWSLTGGYAYVTIVNNVSVTLALYGLLYLYMATHDELHQFEITPKLLCIKGVLFLSFWQGIVIALLASVHIVHATARYTVADVSIGLQDMLVCIEMFYAAMFIERAYSFESYRATAKASKAKPLPLLERLQTLLSFRDVYAETRECLLGSAPSWTQFNGPATLAPAGKADKLKSH